MRPSLVVSLLLMCFLLQDAEGIRLEKEFVQVGSAQKVQKLDKSSLKEISPDVLGEEVLRCKEGHCTSTTMKKSVSRSVLSKKSSPHWLPRIHEDYCGPMHHKPRHH